MDLDFLYGIQCWRESIGGCFDNFFLFITLIAVDYFIMVPALIIYWNFSKRRAANILCSYGTSIFFGAFFKATFSVYRPWVRDARIKPVPGALGAATGYSFPSGHVSSTSGFYGGMIAAFKKYWWVIVFGIAMVLLTMFSRLYLGVHTPQDVLVALAVGAASSVLIAFLLNLCDKYKNADIIIYVIATILVIGLLLYISLKSYPLDYIDGKLIVDPKKMTVDGFKDPGVFFGIMTGWFIERRFVKFDTNGTTAQKVARAVVGGFLYIAWETLLVGPVGKIVDNGIMHFFLKMSTPLLFMTLYPIIFKKIESKGFLQNRTVNSN
ncbi:MAG: phosphatase PAP2 family protein [Bacilli bacterium]|nr:phosphatase PAP2 family protein [Bacilli bacterium]